MQGLFFYPIKKIVFFFGLLFCYKIFSSNVAEKSIKNSDQNFKLDVVNSLITDVPNQE